MMERSLVEYIVNALWQVPLLAAAAWLWARLAKPRPQTHHRLWLAVLGLAVLMPMHGIRPPISNVAIRNEASSRMAPVVESVVNRPPSPWYFQFVPRGHTIRVTTTSAKWLVRLYLAAVALGLLRIARAWNGTRLLLARSQETSRQHVALVNYSRRLGVKPPEVRESAEVSSPMVVGVAEPVLLLPQNFEKFTPAEIEAALCHELAHIKRRDSATNVVCQFVALPLIWHPVMVQIQQQIRLTRELVCDAMAAEEMKSDIGYARCLFALAQSILGEGTMKRQQPWIGLFSHNTLEERMTQLMDTTTMDIRTRLIRRASAAAIMITSSLIVLSFHVSPMMAEAQAPSLPQTTESVPGVSQTEFSAAHATASGTDQVKHVRPHRDASTVDRQKLKEQLAEANEQIAKATAMLESPEFKQQIENAARQAADAKAMLDRPEFKKQIEDAARQSADARAMLDNPEFKKQMKDAKRQAANARAMFDNAEFKKQMEDAERQVANAKAMFDNPEFKKQMEDAKRQAASAGAMFDNPEFKRQMEELRDRLRDDMQRGEDPQ